MTAFNPWSSLAMAAQVRADGQAGGAGIRLQQAHRLQRLLRHAAQRSPLYAQLLSGRSLAAQALSSLPVVRKPELMERFDEWVTDRRVTLQGVRRFAEDPANIGRPYLGRYMVWESSGSSREPAVFVQEPQAMAVYDALEALRRPGLRPAQRWMDPFWMTERIAFVGAIDGHFASTVSMERLRCLNPLLGPRLHSLSFLQPMRELVAQLNALQPTILTTYPSVAVVLAREAEAGRLRVPVREVWTGGEDLSPAMRGCVERAFGCKVANSYGASEFLTLAFECHRASLHLNSDWAILEPVDERGRPVPAGETGETTLLTNLANRVQPLIRYDLRDRVRLHTQPCACGSPLPVIEVQGRSDDTLVLGAQPGQAVAVPPLAVCTVLESDAGLFDFQLVQESPTRLLLRTGLAGADADAALRRGRLVLRAYLHRLGLDGVEVHCLTTGSLPLGRSGKSRRIIGAPQPCAAPPVH